MFLYQVVCTILRGCKSSDKNIIKNQRVVCLLDVTKPLVIYDIAKGL